MGWYAYLCAIVGAIVVGALAGWIIGLGVARAIELVFDQESVPGASRRYDVWNRCEPGSAIAAPVGLESAGK
jgi:hypothetical protein